MSRRIALALAAATIAAPAAAAGGADAAGADANAAKCRSAVIGGKRTCLHAGQRCARKYQKRYLRAGFSCSRPNSRSRYRLVVNKQSF